MIWKIVLAAALAGSVVAGDLPKLSEKPWKGWFAGWEARGFRFGVNAKGEAYLAYEDVRDDEVSEPLWIRVEPVIEQLQGLKIVTKRGQAGGWEAVTEAMVDPEEITYRGTVAGGARYEMTFKLDGKTVTGGGRLLEKGSLTGHPIRFAVLVRVPNVYQYRSNEGRLEAIAEDDRIELVKEDGEKLRFDAFEPVFSDDYRDTGFKDLVAKVEGFHDARLELSAGQHAVMGFDNYRKQPLYKGFTMIWRPDPEKDPEGEARFELTFK